ncbi:MAG: hypothetical protein DRQ61_02190 [Gammaproteobacteria bacterium]|nr:MAG: hypothetical protein DRQ61_02190 [Gammaproteobacteria bacterium]
MINFKGRISGVSETLIRLFILLIAGSAIIGLFMGEDEESERPEGLIQILPYTLQGDFYSDADESKEWRVEFILPSELQSDGQAICEDFVGSKQYLALTSIEPHSQNGTTRFAPVWIREDLRAVASGRYRCDLNANGTNIPWQVPQAELDEINFRNRNRMPL